MNKNEFLTKLTEMMNDANCIIIGEAKLMVTNHVYMVVDGCRYDLSYYDGKYEISYIPEAQAIVKHSMYHEKAYPVETADEVVAVFELWK